MIQPQQDQQPEAQQPQQPQQDQPEIHLLLPEETRVIRLSLEELDLILDQVERIYQTAPRDELTTTLLLACKPVARAFLMGLRLTQRPGWPQVPHVQRGEDVNLVALRYILRHMLALAARFYPTLDLAPLLALQAWRRSVAALPEAQVTEAPAEDQVTEGEA